MADFTSWSSLLSSIRNSLANRDLAVGEYRTPDGTQVVYRSLAELRELEGWAAERAATEAITASSGEATRSVRVKFGSRY